MISVCLSMLGTDELRKGCSCSSYKSAVFWIGTIYGVQLRKQKIYVFNTVVITGQSAIAS